MRQALFQATERLITVPDPAKAQAPAGNTPTSGPFHQACGTARRAVPSTCCAGVPSAQLGKGGTHSPSGWLFTRWGDTAVKAQGSAEVKTAGVRLILPSITAAE